MQRMLLETTFAGRDRAETSRHSRVSEFDETACLSLHSSYTIIWITVA